jgi:hypothetical protein
MKGKLPDQKQASLFEPNLHQIVHPAHELVLLAEKIEWEYIDIQSEYQRKKLRRLFRRRATIEPLIGHLKSDHRKQCSFYKGFHGDQINVLLASAAWNMKRFMKKLSEAFYFPFFRMLWRILVCHLPQLYPYIPLLRHTKLAFSMTLVR